MKAYDWVADLQSTYPNKPLVLVEGEDDVPLFRKLFALIDPDWQLRFEVEYAKGKMKVFQGCQRVLAWRGLVDRDEWSEARIAEEWRKSPNAHVRVLPRFAAENYWIDPDELQALIPASVLEAHPTAQAQLTAEIESKRPDWTAHGAMWRVMLNCQTGLGDLRFPQELTEGPVTDETQIREILTRWHDHLRPDDILAKYRSERDAALASPPHEQYTQVIHGKRFFRRVITPALNRAFGTSGKEATSWAADLTASMTSVPTDLRPVLEDLLRP